MTVATPPVCGCGGPLVGRHPTFCADCRAERRRKGLATSKPAPAAGLIPFGPAQAGSRGESRLKRSRREWRERKARGEISPVAERMAESQRRRRHVAEQARFRPAGVTVISGEEAPPENEDMAVLKVPDTASAPAQAFAGTMAAFATLRLMNGDSLDFSLYRVAGGRDSLARVTVRDFDLDRPGFGAAMTARPPLTRWRS